MNEWDGIDPVRTRLRVLVAHVEGALSSLGGADGANKQALERAWADLVGALDLGLEPELRNCPSCGRGIMQRAVRCRYCMKFSPIEPSRPE